MVLSKQNENCALTHHPKDPHKYGVTIPEPPKNILQYLLFRYVQIQFISFILFRESLVFCPLKRLAWVLILGSEESCNLRSFLVIMCLCAKNEMKRPFALTRAEKTCVILNAFGVLKNTI